LFFLARKVWSGTGREPIVEHYLVQNNAIMNVRGIQLGILELLLQHSTVLEDKSSTQSKEQSVYTTLAIGFNSNSTDCF
jgi:hypothetical protein